MHRNVIHTKTRPPLPGGFRFLLDYPCQEQLEFRNYYRLGSSTFIVQNTTDSGGFF
jgi:hypothetical protein